MLLWFLERVIIRLFDFISAASYTIRRRLSRRPRAIPGIVIGQAANQFRPNRTEVISLSSDQRLKSVYLLGGTGSGKTKSIEGMVVEDMKQGNGFTVIDPHGDLTENILRHAARPNETALADRLVLVEPFNPDWSIGFNPLECPDKKNSYSLVLEMMGIFRRLWGEGSWGPRMDELLRNVLVSLSESGLTLLEASSLLTDGAFRNGVIVQVENQQVREYWQRYNALSDKMQAAYREPVLNKVSTFTSDPNIRVMLGQARSTLNFRNAMDEGKWILINLSKGQLKENTFLLGSLLLAKLKLGAISRVDINEELRRPHTIYVDEFQNFCGSDYDFETILSESRKFKLGLTIAHQTLGQISPQLRSVIFGNVCTLLFFRLSAHDAATVAAEMGYKDKSSIERKLCDLGVGQAYLKIKGRPATLLRVSRIHTPDASDEQLSRLKLFSFQTHARRRDEIEREIAGGKGPLLKDRTGRVEIKTARPQAKNKRGSSKGNVDHGKIRSDEGQSSW